ncbi:MAG: RnfABCDGE type electron transport complex subunit D [Candidatus Omnitrophica bacterium]|nr:RnfABCDGE type electron transport complex subunit D [Candidatus Omnitrophota bacterium]
MKDKLLNVSLSPHVYGRFSVHQMMVDVVIALLPALAMSVYIFGLHALRVTLIAIVSAVLFEYIIQKFMLKVKPSISDGSAIVTGLLLAYNLPSNLPWWIIVVGSLVSIGLGKMSFGGLGNNPFNPALVGRVFLVISFPVEMTTWPKPLLTDRWQLADASTHATPLAIVKEGLFAGEAYPDLIAQIPSYLDLFLGRMGGCIGEISALALLLGCLYLLYRKVITWHAPVSMLGSMFIFSGLLWLTNPAKFADPLFHVLAGGAFLGAIYMTTDLVTSPMTHQGMLIFGTGIGIITILIRVFGAYPEGVSFAILIMNAFVPLINRMCKPKRFGE